MLRQIYIYFEKNIIFSYSYALAFNDQQFKKVQDLLLEFVAVPIPDQFFHRPFGNYQLSYLTSNHVFYLFIADIVDKKEYINEILNKTIKRFQFLFSNPLNIKKENKEKESFIQFLREVQYNLHSKIALIGPLGSGKTLFTNLIRTKDEPKSFMNFAKSYKIEINNFFFDLWDFQLNDNFSPLWNKLISGSDLILLVIDSTDYNREIISHFINLQKTDAKFSKLLILANKQDLSNAVTPTLIEEELKIPTIGVSLKDPGIKNQLIRIISDQLNLKKEMPSEFDDLLLNAENNVINKEYSEAIKKFNNLIDICKEFQEFTLMFALEQRIIEIENLIKEEEKQKEIEKYRTDTPEKIIFTKKVSVKSLPTQETNTTIKLSAKKEFNKIEKTTKRTSLKQQDFKINLDVLKKDEISKNSLKTLEEQLFNIIKQKHGSISLKLCKIYIDQLKEKIKRPLTRDDLNKAAEIFIKRKEDTNYF